MVVGEESGGHRGEVVDRQERWWTDSRGLCRWTVMPVVDTREEGGLLGTQGRMSSHYDHG